MRELDVILERYLLRDAPCAGAGELAVFDQILELPDPDLARYLVAGDSAADPATRALLERLRTA